MSSSTLKATNAFKRKKRRSSRVLLKMKKSKLKLSEQSTTKIVEIEEVSEEAEVVSAEVVVAEEATVVAVEVQEVATVEAPLVVTEDAAMMMMISTIAVRMSPKR